MLIEFLLKEIVNFLIYLFLNLLD